MRIDHIAYQRAVRVAGGGFLAQLALGLVLIIAGRVLDASVATIASFYVLSCLPIWLGLVIVFHQHRLERLETLEQDELLATRGEAAVALFEQQGARVAGRRLKFMHTWLMPIISLVVVIALSVLGWLVIDWFRDMNEQFKDVPDFKIGRGSGWQLAVAIALSLAAFIFSRFVAGMSKLDAWANLRGGAAAMVGNALVLLAIAIGLVFDFFQMPKVIEGIAYGIAIFMFVVAAEIVLNLILNLYRPRRADETPRPAFDSKLLSLFAAPDSIVRSINEAVNYQFGFDITSSWGYQLLLRSVGRLAIFGLVVLVLLSTIVVVQPGQQAMRLRFGRPVGGVYESAMMWKAPWPVDTALVEDVGRVRPLALGYNPAPPKDFADWGAEGILDPNRNIYVVMLSGRGEPPPDPTMPTVDRGVGLIDADVVLQYRVRDGQLDKWMTFANDVRLRRGNTTVREKVLKNVATREVTMEFASRSVEQLLSGAEGDSLVRTLHGRIQASFDALNCGVELVGVTIPRLRPPGGDEAQKFVETTIASQNARKLVEAARAQSDAAMSGLVGTPEIARNAVAAIRRLQAMESSNEGESPAALELRAEIERMLTSQPSMIASGIDNARAERWRKLTSAQKKTSEVLGQAAAYAVDPDFFRERKLMQFLAESLPTVRVKYILSLPPERVRLQMEMQEPDGGLNAFDYIRKEGE
ncbi:MAG: hypothetical protein JNM94_13350 [Phycisphaerae bacterium]|nr:hypothetical protein [Phycisphaerae bacterium]